MHPTATSADLEVDGIGLKLIYWLL